MSSRRHSRITTIAACGALVAGVLVSASGGAHADTETGNLPGGTGLSVSIDSPDDNAVMPLGDVTVSGGASVGQAAPVKNTGVVFVMDLSGSTIASGGACGGDLNSDGSANTILDCEVAASMALNNTAVSNGTVGEAGLAVFGSSGAATDVQPDAMVQLNTAPDADRNSNSARDMDEVFTSVDFGSIGLFSPFNVGSGSTNFVAAVQTANQAAATMASPNKVVAFMSDGASNVFSGNAVTEVGNRPAGTTYYTFAVGSGASCTNAGSQGSLAQIATATGGTCTSVTDVSSLPDILPGVVEATLDSLEISVNGGTSAPVTASATLPVTGPESVTYSHTLTGLGSGVHDVCVRANGTDVGGTGSVTDCHQIVLYDPSDGFVTGGGSIASPIGAYVPDPTLEGKATFGFVSKYQRGATIPSGNSQFVFHAAGLSFHSTSYDWLVVPGANAQYKGTGTVSGLDAALNGTYKFMIWATDGALAGSGGADAFRIKLWQEDALGAETVLYDNGSGSTLTGGSIIIHKK